ncbi:MAG: heavy metal translocating P-type ATPase, partial [Sagittula sp.]
MSSDGNRNDHGHPSDQEHSNPRGKSCCDASKDVASTAPAPSGGRSFQVSGLDCAEEVAILNRVVGPKVGGTEHLAFDVINGRMTILDS